MKKILLALALLMLPTLALAQNAARNPCYSVNGVGCNPVGTNTPFPVTGSSNVPSYSASVNAFANSSAGDVYCINGSATKTIKVKGIRISALASAAIADDIAVIKRSTANSGGTPTTITPVPNDSLNAAATATVKAFATAPTPGTSVGQVRSQVITIPTTAAAVSPVLALFQFTPYWDQPIVLHGVAEGICVNVPSTAGGQWSIDSEFTEE
jgi:hypothetical protein